MCQSVFEGYLRHREDERGSVVMGIAWWLYSFWVITYRDVRFVYSPLIKRAIACFAMGSLDLCRDNSLVGERAYCPTELKRFYSVRGALSIVSFIISPTVG